MRQLDKLWWLSDDNPGIVLYTATFSNPGDGTSRVTTQGDHVIVAITAARESFYGPAPPPGWDFYNAAGAVADLSSPVEPIFTQGPIAMGTFATDSGPEPVFAYTYVLPLTAGKIHYKLRGDLIGVAYGIDAVLGIGGMTRLGGDTGGASYDTKELSHTIPFANGDVDIINGLWLLAAHPAADRQSGDIVEIGWPGQQLGPDPLAGWEGEAGVPGFVIGSAGPSSGGNLEFTFAEPGAISATWLQLVPRQPPPIPTDATIPLAGAVSGSIAVGPFGAVTGVAVPPVAAHVVTVDNPYVSLGTLDNSFGRSWQDQVSEPGSGVVQLDNDDPDLALIDENTLIRFELNGRAEFLMMPNVDDKLTVAPGEEADQITTLTGPGNLGILANAVVYPSRGTGSVPIEEDRVFSWPSPDYDDSAWGTATFLMSVDAARESWPAIPFGEGFPENSGAEVIWAPAIDPDYPGPNFTHPEGDCYFRATVDFPSNGRVVIYALIDNYGEVFFDGQPVLVVSPSDGFNTVTAFGLDVSLGEHTIAVRGHNSEDDLEAGYNPGCIAIAIYDADINNQPLSGNPLWVTSSEMLLVAYPPVPPGMTPGEVALILLDEALARDALPIGTLWRTFDRDTDSNGNPWPEVGEIATKVGTDYLTFFREMSATYFDMWMSPAGFDLNLFSLDGQGLTTDIDWHPPTDPLDPSSGNVEHLQHTRAT